MQRKFIIRIILTCLPVLAVYLYPMLNFMLGTCYGDLNNLGTPFFSTEYSKVFNFQPEISQKVLITDDCSRDCRECPDSSILVIGDSFSQQGNRSFVEYLNQYLPEYKVMMVKTQINAENSWMFVWRDRAFNHMTEYLTFILENAEYLPKTIVMESEEIVFISRMTTASSEVRLEDQADTIGLNFARTQLNAEMATYDRSITEAFSFSNKWLKRLFHINKSNNVKHFPLAIPSFSCSGKESDLYVHSENLKPIKQEIIDKCVKKKRELTELAAKRGVKLFFFICPSKYTMYQSLIIGNHPEQPSVFERLKTMNADDYVIDNQRILTPYINEGNTDLYFCNDTHWTYKAAEITAKQFSTILKDSI